MKIKESVFDRIEQSFNVFKNNFKELFLPFFLYNFLSTVIVGTIVTFLIISQLSQIGNLASLDLFGFLNNSFVVISITIGIFAFILYLLLYIVVLLGFIKSIKQAVDGESVTMLENLKYGVNSFFSSMKIYWYIFAYVALIPAIIFIIGGLFLNIGLLTDTSSLMILSYYILGTAVILFIYFSIYRGMRTTFSIFSAASNNEYTEENFKHSLIITKNNWWRIFGNYLLIGILLGLISSFISGIVGLFSLLGNSNSGLLDIINNSGGEFKPELIESMLNDMIADFSITGTIIQNTFNNILSTILSVFALIFTYIFYLRLHREKIYNDENKKETTIDEIIL